MKQSFFLFLLALPVLLGAQTDTLGVAARVDSLLNASTQFSNLKAHDKALETSAAAEKLALEKTGSTSALHGKTCFQHARNLSVVKNYPEAEKWYLESLHIWETRGDTTHPVYLKTLGNMGLLSKLTNRLAQAEQYYLRGVSLSEKGYGNQSLEYAKGLFDASNFYIGLGRLGEADSLLVLSAVLREKLLGKEHPDYQACITNQILIYNQTGQFDKAEQVALDALRVPATSPALKSIHCARILNNLASVYLRTSNYEKGESMLLRALPLLEKHFGKENPEYLTAHGNLASLHYFLGEYEKAEKLYLESLPRMEKAKGKSSKEYADLLSNLASLHISLGNYEQAEKWLSEARNIYEITSGKEQSGYCGSGHALATVHFYRGDFSRAETFVREVLSIQEKTKGIGHPDYGTSLSLLAAVLLEKGDFEKAEQLFLQALSIHEKAIGKETVEHALPMYNLADLYFRAGQFDRAATLLAESRALLEKLQGKETPNYVKTRYLEADVLRRTGKSEAAEAALVEVANLEKDLLLKGARHLSEVEMFSYIRLFSNNLAKNYAFAQAGASPGFVGNCFDNSLFFKGFLLESFLRNRSRIAADSTLNDRHLSLKSYHRRIAAEYAKAPSARQNLAELEAKANELEKELAQGVAGYADAWQQVRWQEVQQRLQPGEAAIEFVHFRLPGTKDSTWYAALLLRPGEANPQFIPLFEEKTLDQKLRQHPERRSDYVNDLYAFAGNGSRSLAGQTTSLYEILWKPLEPQLTGVHTVYYASSGLLHRLSLDAISLPDSPAGEDGETLAGRYRLVKLGSTRQLAFSPAGQTVNREAVLIGAVNYEVDSTALLSQTVPNTAFATRNEPGFNQVDSTLRALPAYASGWNYLKWTDKEVESIAALLKTAGASATLKKGTAATEEFFKSIGKDSSSPRVIHIATHGYFFPDPAPTPQPPKGGAGAGTGGGSPLGAGGVGSAFKMSEHPMIRSGLVLAGGNHAWKTGQSLQPGMEDGILTAYEISQMNLSNTELVVLSACETGLGDILGNEGVYGLQRAFKIAGAKYLVMSLWQVPDFQTQELMTLFYSKWQKEQLSIPEAFRTAQREMRERYQHPFFWAGFVLVE